MSELELWAVTEAGPVPLPVPGTPRDLHELFELAPLGVYSGLRTYEHVRFLRLEQHLGRTERSAALLGWTEPLDRALLRRGLHTLVSAYSALDTRVRFDWLPAPSRVGGTTCRLLVGLAPLVPIAPELMANGVRLGLCPLRRPTPLVKTTDFVRQRRSCTELDPSAYEHLMVDESGRVLEGTSSNFFGVRAGTLVTAGEGVLEGITRRIILELADGLGIEVSLAGLRLGELGGLDEAFISSSTREIVPAVEVARCRIGSGRPGPVTRALHAAFRRFADANARPAIAGLEAQPAAASPAGL
jgi:branched-chain amino acid aminotransferase